MFQTNKDFLRSCAFQEKVYAYACLLYNVQVINLWETFKEICGVQRHGNKCTSDLQIASGSKKGAPKKKGPCKR